MKPELKKKILDFNKARAQEKEQANDLMTLLQAMPKGQVKRLLKDDACARILKKHGITG